MIDITTLSTEEKIQTMEMLWDDLSQKPSFQSPNWHGEELTRREKEISLGNSELINWEEAKRNIKDRIES